jgi:hypothetical protein
MMQAYISITQVLYSNLSAIRIAMSIPSSYPTLRTLSMYVCDACDLGVMHHSLISPQVAIVSSVFQDSCQLFERWGGGMS